MTGIRKRIQCTATQTVHGQSRSSSITGITCTGLLWTANLPSTRVLMALSAASITAAFLLWQ